MRKLCGYNKKINDRNENKRAHQFVRPVPMLNWLSCDKVPKRVRDTTT